MNKLLLIFVVILFAASPLAADSSVDSRIIELRLKGQLVDAEQAALEALQVPRLTDADAMYLHLELATIYDRMALHDGTRPSAKAKAQLKLAADKQSTDDGVRADYLYGAARYLYRAEMDERKFERAESFARRALIKYESERDIYGQAEATHLLGLIEMQRRDLEAAAVLFDRSLELDQEAGERVFFRGEYERHMGFVIYLRGDVAESLPYFRRSVAARSEAGADDALVFAKISLASVLEELDHNEEAAAVANDALAGARAMNSKTAEERTRRVIERLQ